ncbi:MAG: protein kinase [Candidatus Riflebacteria bacterium]|nr:protein kinase [Candidatus Riflebacteria bacterium]
MIGKTIWKYRITEFLGAGGSAKVWKAYDERTKKEVAIKVLPEDFDQNLLARFRHETRAISQLDHPNVIKIYDIGTEGKINYYVMEYLRGKTLKELIHERYEIEKSSVNAEESVQISLDVARALEYIHSRRIYHRDIKPGNIYVTEEGVSILMDFGIAKVVDETTLTAVGTLMGTPLYMSPEQLQAHEVDQRSDIYQMGIVMYKMTTGKVPFEGDNSYSAAARRLTERIPVPSRYNPTISPQLEKIILKCTQRDKKDRYQSSTQLVADLTAVSESRDVTVELKPRGLDGKEPKATSEATGQAGSEESGRTRRSHLFRASLAVNALLLVSLLGLLFGSRSRPLELILSGRKVETTFSTATIAFRTNVPVPSEVAYGHGEELSQLKLVSAEPTTDHRVVVDGLNPAMEYGFALRFIVDRRLVTYKPERFKTKEREELDRLTTRPLPDMPPEEVALLVDALKAGDYQVRLQAVHALGDVGTVKIYDKLIPLLHDKNNEVREAAAKLLAKLARRF